MEFNENQPHTPFPRSSSPFSTHEDEGLQENIPIDWLTLLPFLLLRIIDAITFTLIFPFIIEYITSLNVPSDKIGLYAGIAEGSMMFAEAIGSPFWSILADKVGRKRSFVWGFGVAVLAVGMIGFGRGVWWITLWRFVYGLNPTPVLSRIYITELSHPTNREYIFSIYSPIFNFGHLFGLLLGSWSSNLYGRLPVWMGGESTFLKRWPYALPCLVNAGL
ncbi:hypothetical protein I302_108104 [Kwoniella bestiolae CBS 10118]|uniref:Major facilitator superfamily (MFS) profile domain-containing protein n=1 Tax=Kwoniella bestiolae CBS 10118 TaxID=1296100 RepID=A0A1B9FWN4_9TREE|nr:hypothetical protein I302_07531 [Kwoniella bestiolae CBS 10118]OCF23178.1 hypothetical protein I302_07531 [Kwoniella bestiolae CBS 10118]